MAGPSRRPRRLKQATDAADITGFLLVNPTDGDLLVYDSTNSGFENSKNLTGPYTLSGLLTLDDLTVIDDATIGDALTVGGATQLNGSLTVQLAAIFNDNTTVNNTLDVNGVTTLGDALSVAGALTGSGFSFTGSGQIDGNLTVDGTLTAGALSFTDLALTGNLTVGGTTGLTGALTGSTAAFSGNVTVGALASAGQVTGMPLATATTVDGPSWSIDSDTVSTEWRLGATITNGNTILSGRLNDGVNPSSIEDMLVLNPQGVLVDASDTTTGRVDFTASDPLLNTASAIRLTNAVDDGILYLSGFDTGSVQRDKLSIDPNGAVAVIGTTDGDPATNPADFITNILSFRSRDDNLYAELGYPNTSSFRFTGHAREAGFRFDATDDLGALERLVDFDPQGATQPGIKFWYDDTQIARFHTRGLDVADSEGNDDPRIRLMDAIDVATLAQWDVFADNVRFDNRVVGANSIIFRLSAAAAADTTALTLTTTEVQANLNLRIDADLDHDGSNIGFFGTAPAAQTAAYTQTFATATRTHANPTTTGLTDSTGGTTDGTLVAVPAVNGSGATTAQEAAIDDNFAEVAGELAAVIADLDNLKQVVNSLIDDGQTYGLLQ